MAVFSQSTLPVSRSSAMTTNLCSLAASVLGMAVVRKMRLPAKTGVEKPRPAIGTFQATFLESDHSVGAAPSATPLKCGPRQFGQSPAEAAARVKNARIAVRRISLHCTRVAGAAGVRRMPFSLARVSH